MKEALKLALDALEMHVPHVYKDRGYGPITAIKEALAQDEQEPFGYVWLDTANFRKKVPPTGESEAWNAVYTTPPQRLWVGLTDEEIEEAYAKPTLRKMYQAIEAKLKEKNT